MKQISFHIKNQFGQEDTGEIKISSDFKFPIIIDENFSKYLQKFMHSYRNKEHPTVNINNLLFLSGPQKNGKSWFLRHNLKKFEEEAGDLKTMVIHYDILKKGYIQSFYTFLFNFEREIIRSIVRRNKYEQEKFNRNLINFDDLKDLLFFRWEKGWIEINLSKALKRAVNEPENESPYTFYIDNSRFREEVLNIIEKYEKKAFKEYVLVEELDKINVLISQSMGVDEVESGLLLFQDLLIQREDYRKNLKIFKNELYRDGLEVMEYFFDVINYIAGYHEKQIKEEFLRNVDDPIRIFPHVVMAIESVSHFFEMKDAERRPLDYLHRIMLRLFVIIKIN
jgi:hypothetical protein